MACSPGRPSRFSARRSASCTWPKTWSSPSPSRWPRSGSSWRTPSSPSPTSVSGPSEPLRGRRLSSPRLRGSARGGQLTRFWTRLPRPTYVRFARPWPWWRWRSWVCLGPLSRVLGMVRENAGESWGEIERMSRRFMKGGVRTQRRQHLPRADPLAPGGGT